MKGKEEEGKSLLKGLALGLGALSALILALLCIFL